MNALRVLIIKPSALGDVATALPLLCDLKRAYPGAEMDWLVHPAYAALLEGHDAVHAVIPFDRKALASWWWKPAAFGKFWALLKELRRRRYDLVIDAQGLFRSGFLARVTGAPVRIGFAHAREFAGVFYTKKVPLPGDGKKMLAVDRMRALVGPLDVNTKGKAEFRVPVRGMQGLVPGLESGSSYVVIIPGARWETKRWAIERYRELAKRLLEAGERIVLLGSPDEKPLCDQLITPTGSAAVNLAGKTTLGEMIAVLAGARLVIGNDSGPLHVAVALGRPIVGLYGPTDPDYVGPYGQMDHVVRFDVECHPCRRKTCDHHSCMVGLTVESVWEKVRGILAYVRP